MNKEDMEEARPVLRSLLAFLVYLRFGEGDLDLRFGEGDLEKNYAVADSFLDQLEKDLSA